MESLVSKIFSLFFFLVTTVGARYGGMEYNFSQDVSRTIFVDKRGRGNFTTVQQAIDSVPSNNSKWIRIHLNHGLYMEKVVIPRDRPYVVLEGEARHMTTIEYGDFGSSFESSTFKVFADNFVARNVIFKNSYDRLIMPGPNGRKTTWAPAASIDGDKASFYHCTFISLQDTLNDHTGRHYFYDTYIEGAIDFIWGDGQSIYEKCHINTIASMIGRAGYITAHGRNDSKELTGYVFKDCHVFGTGLAYLGRPWRPYSRVVFASTYMDNVVRPEGWATWGPSPLNLITFSEVNCVGPGADMAHRVPWEKKLTDHEVAYFTNPASFIDQEGWLGKQPN